jgi:hypothetical protein
MPHQKYGNFRCSHKTEARYLVPDDRRLNERKFSMRYIQIVRIEVSPHQEMMKKPKQCED